LICGGSFVSFICMAPKRHPLANRSIIDYDLAFMLQPLSIGGTVLGVLLHDVIPSWLVLLLLLIVLLATTYRTAIKGYDLWKAESRVSREFSQVVQPNEIEIISLDEGDEQHPSISTSKELQDLINKESKTPWRLLAVQLGVIMMLLLFAIFRGSAHGVSIIGIKGCSTNYWLLAFGIFPILFLVSLFWARKLVSMNEYKEKLYYPFKQGDLHWTKNRTVVISLVALLAGIVSSLLGIGGGMVIVPIILELQVLPEVIVATSSFMILFTSLASVMQYIIQQELKLDYAIWFGILGAISSLVGQTILSYLVKQYKKKSYIIIAITFIIGTSTILLVATSIMNVMDQIRSGADMGFRNLCR